MIGMVFFCAASTVSYSQEKFTVSGEVKFPEKKGVIILMLNTQQEFEDRESPPPERKLMIKPDAQQLKAKKVPFKFVDLPKGSYAIRCIQDLNENGELDYFDSGVGVRHPTEPYGFSGSFMPMSVIWSDVKFEVDKDISGIEIELRGL